MNTKLKPPCKVLFDGKVFDLRNLSFANKEMKLRRGWKGLVAHLQNEQGTTLVEYHRLNHIKTN